MVMLRKAFNKDNIGELYEAIRNKPVSRLDKSLNLEPILKMLKEIFLGIFYFPFKNKSEFLI